MNLKNLLAVLAATLWIFFSEGAMSVEAVGKYKDDRTHILYQVNGLSLIIRTTTTAEFHTFEEGDVWSPEKCGLQAIARALDGEKDPERCFKQRIFVKGFPLFASDVERVDVRFDLRTNTFSVSEPKPVLEYNEVLSTLFWIVLSFPLLRVFAGWRRHPQIKWMASTVVVAVFISFIEIMEVTSVTWVLAAMFLIILMVIIINHIVTHRDLSLLMSILDIVPLVLYSLFVSVWDDSFRLLTQWIVAYVISGAIAILLILWKGWEQSV